MDRSAAAREVVLMAERFVVTGADGCVGAWVTRLLLDEGAEVIGFDLGTDDRRHQLVSGGAPLSFQRVTGDISDASMVSDALAGADRIIHLAALQVPSCRADPNLGARVNLVGTINVFEAARAHGIETVAYASSVAVYGSAEDYPEPVLDAGAPPRPRTLYGVYKVACEQAAAVYAEDFGVGSIGLRPHTVFGPGRDQGMTSQPTVAISHALRSTPYTVGYRGRLDFQYAPDVARLFVAAARVALEVSRSAPVLNLRGHVTTVERFVERVRAQTGFTGLSCEGDPLPLVHAASPTGLAELLGNVPPTPLREAIASTVQILAAGNDES